MLVISRKSGQKIMINDNIVITIVDAKNGSCKIAIEADKDVKIYREEIYYQIKLANLIGKDSNVNSVDSVANMLSGAEVQLNKQIRPTNEANDVQIEKKEGKTFVIRKNSSPQNDV